MVAVHPNAVILEVLNGEITIPNIDAYRFGHTLHPGNTHSFNDVIGRLIKSIREEFDLAQGVLEDRLDKISASLEGKHPKLQDKLMDEMIPDMELYDNHAATEKFLRCIEGFYEGMMEILDTGTISRSDKMVLGSNLRIVHQFLNFELDQADEMAKRFKPKEAGKSFLALVGKAEPVKESESAAKNRETAAQFRGNALLLSHLIDGVEEIAKALNVNLDRGHSK